MYTSIFVCFSEVLNEVNHLYDKQLMIRTTIDVIFLKYGSLQNAPIDENTSITIEKILKLIFKLINLFYKYTNGR